MKERMLFGRLIRKGVTDEFYPEKITMDGFQELIMSSFQDYERNITNIKADEPKYVEEWIEQYLTWLEIEQD